MKPLQYKEFVFFSAGPVGDHVILIDFANRFFESTGIPSRIIMKHPNSFLRDFALPYYDHISYIEFTGWKGKFAMFKLTLTSLVTPHLYINVLPIVTPGYYRFFAYFIRFCTRSRFVGFNLEGSRSFPIGKGSSYFLGRNNYIPAEINKNLFYQEANRMLNFLGYKNVSSAPRIDFIQDDTILKEHSLVPKGYVVFHITASHVDRSFPEDKWYRIIKNIQEKLPELMLVFTGSLSDKKFIEECLGDIPLHHVVLVCGSASTQQLLTLHAHAVLNVTVHTGNAHFINMLHVPTLTLNIKGVYFFKFYYNEKGEELVAVKNCTCDLYERECTMIPYHNRQYMACLYNIDENDVVNKIVSMYATLYVK